MPQAVLPIGKPEIYDGVDYYALASENWVLNTIRRVSPTLVATTANLTATYANGTGGVGATLTNSDVQAAISIDGVSLSTNDRVLVKDQSTAFQNGIYKVTTVGSLSTNWVLTRVSDYDVIAQIVRGDFIDVISGTINSVTAWMLTTNISIIGTDVITFVKLAQSGITNILGTSNQIGVSISNGIATLTIANNPVIPGTASITIPTGTTAQRPTPNIFGMIRANTDFYHYECRNINGIDWDPFITKIRGVSNQIAISGTPSEPSLGLVDDLYLFGTGYVKIPAGTTAQRGIDTYLGMMRLNTDSMNVEYYNNNGWSTMGSGNVTSVGINSSSSGLNITGSPITSSGTITLTLGTELHGLSGLSANGIITRTASGTYASRTITAGSGISVTNGSGVSGNPTIAVNNIPINTLSGYPSFSNYFLRGDGNWSDTLTGNFSVNGMVTITGASGTITSFAYFKKEGSSAASGYWSDTGLSLALKCTTGSVAAVEFEATSSIKKKNILMNLNDSKEELRRKFDNINFVKYEWIDKQQEGFGEYYGYIAENIAEEFPELVNLEHMEYSPSILKFADIKNVELKIYDIFFKEDVDIPVLSKIKILIFINDKEEQREVLVLRKINFSTYRISTGEDIPVNHNIFVYGIYESVPLVSKTRFHDMTAARLKILIDEVNVISEKINMLENKRYFK